MKQIKRFKLTHNMYAILHSLQIALIGECFIVIEGKSCFVLLPFIFVTSIMDKFSPKTNRRNDVFNGNVPTNDDISSDELNFIPREWEPPRLI